MAMLAWPFFQHRMITAPPSMMTNVTRQMVDTFSDVALFHSHPTTTRKLDRSSPRVEVRDAGVTRVSHSGMARFQDLLDVIASASR